MARERAPARQLTMRSPRSSPRTSATAPPASICAAATTMSRPARAASGARSCCPPPSHSGARSRNSVEPRSARRSEPLDEHGDRAETERDAEPLARARPLARRPSRTAPSTAAWWRPPPRPRRSRCSPRRARRIRCRPRTGAGRSGSRSATGAGSGSAAPRAARKTSRSAPPAMMKRMPLSSSGGKPSSANRMAR